MEALYSVVARQSLVDFVINLEKVVFWLLRLIIRFLNATPCLLLVSFLVLVENRCQYVTVLQLRRRLVYTDARNQVVCTLVLSFHIVLRANRLGEPLFPLQGQVVDQVSDSLVRVMIANLVLGHLNFKSNLRELSRSRLDNQLAAEELRKLLRDSKAVRTGIGRAALSFSKENFLG